MPNTENIQITIEDDPQSKKRGRKPKGGKLVTRIMDETSQPPPVENVVLHLKCSLKDINICTNTNEIVKDPFIYNPSAPNEIITYNEDTLYKSYTTIQNDNDTQASNAYTEPYCKKCKCIENGATSSIEEYDEKVSMKDITAKLKKLKIQHYKNISDKKSACFWCTFPFDNHPCYIPRHEMNDVIVVYGTFCRPECAVAYLMKENIDDSIKFERYHLINQIYGKIYDYKKNIKPAPNPYYLLEKFQGNLTIQEYRKLLKTEHMLVVIDKPLTRILPELHEDNDEFIMGIYGGIQTTQTQQQNGGVYKVKRQSEKTQGPSKSSLIKDAFGM
jgi:hypothetical protein